MSKIANYSKRNFHRKRKLDTLSGDQRSRLMSAIRSKGTRFELEFISKLSEQSVSGFETHCNDLLGKPDIVFREKMLCIFLDSDFWHGWQYPRWKHLLKSDFWRDKISSNRKRDIKVTRVLRKRGWRVLRIWEHSIASDLNGVLLRVLKNLNN